MKTRFVRVLLALSLLLCAATPAFAQFNKPEMAVEYRQSAMFLMGNHLGRIKAQLDVSKPDLNVVRASALVIDELKSLPFEAFLPGTDKVEESAAKPEIWTDAERFKKLAGEMQDRVAELDTVAKAGDVAAIRKAFEDTGKACKSCHEDFRRKR